MNTLVNKIALNIALAAAVVVGSTLATPSHAATSAQEEKAQLKAELAVVRESIKLAKAQARTEKAEARAAAAVAKEQEKLAKAKEQLAALQAGKGASAP